jgi:CMP/dCMP kinase
MVHVITIDGPSGSGKGTLSEMLAAHLGYHLLDSGALYRLTALAAIKKNIDLNDESSIANLAEKLNVKFPLINGHTRIYLDEVDVTDDIRQESVSMGASKVAAYPSVRAALLNRQCAFAEEPGLVADGRDMGTVVFPEATIKFFLTASAEARAERRYKQLVAKGQPVDLQQLIKDIRERDERDTNRIVAPLKPAVNAIVIDSTAMTIDEVLNFMLSEIAKCR